MFFLCYFLISILTMIFFLFQKKTLFRFSLVCHYECSHQITGQFTPKCVKKCFRALILLEHPGLIAKSKFQAKAIQPVSWKCQTEKVENEVISSRNSSFYCKRVDQQSCIVEAIP